MSDQSTIFAGFGKLLCSKTHPCRSKKHKHPHEIRTIQLPDSIGGGFISAETIHVEPCRICESLEKDRKGYEYAHTHPMVAYVATSERPDECLRSNGYLFKAVMIKCIEPGHFSPLKGQILVTDQEGKNTKRILGEKVSVGRIRKEKTTLEEPPVFDFTKYSHDVRTSRVKDFDKKATPVDFFIFAPEDMIKAESRLRHSVSFSLKRMWRGTSIADRDNGLVGWVKKQAITQVLAAENHQHCCCQTLDQINEALGTINNGMLNIRAEMGNEGHHIWDKIENYIGDQLEQLAQGIYYQMEETNNGSNTGISAMDHINFKKINDKLRDMRKAIESLQEDHDEILHIERHRDAVILDEKNMRELQKTMHKEFKTTVGGLKNKLLGADSVDLTAINAKLEAIHSEFPMLSSQAHMAVRDEEELDVQARYSEWQEEFVAMWELLKEIQEDLKQNATKRRLTRVQEKILDFLKRLKESPYNPDNEEDKTRLIAEIEELQKEMEDLSSYLDNPNKEPRISEEEEESSEETPGPSNRLGKRDRKDRNSRYNRAEKMGFGGIAERLETIEHILEHMVSVDVISKKKAESETTGYSSSTPSPFGSPTRNWRSVKHGAGHTHRRGDASRRLRMGKVYGDSMCCSKLVRTLDGVQRQMEDIEHRYLANSGGFEGRTIKNWKDKKFCDKFAHAWRWEPTFMLIGTFTTLAAGVQAAADTAYFWDCIFVEKIPPLIIIFGLAAIISIITAVMEGFFFMREGIEDKEVYKPYKDRIPRLLDRIKPYSQGPSCGCCGSTMHFLSSAEIGREFASFVSVLSDFAQLAALIFYLVRGQNCSIYLAFLGCTSAGRKFFIGFCITCARFIFYCYKISWRSTAIKEKFWPVKFSNFRVEKLGKKTSVINPKQEEIKLSALTPNGKVPKDNLNRMTTLDIAPDRTFDPINDRNQLVEDDYVDRSCFGNVCQPPVYMLLPREAEADQVNYWKSRQKFLRATNICIMLASLVFFLIYLGFFIVSFSPKLMKTPREVIFDFHVNFRVQIGDRRGVNTITKEFRNIPVGSTSRSQSREFKTERKLVGTMDAPSFFQWPAQPGARSHLRYAVEYDWLSNQANFAVQLYYIQPGAYLHCNSLIYWNNALLKLTAEKTCGFDCGIVDQITSSTLGKLPLVVCLNQTLVGGRGTCGINFSDRRDFSNTITGWGVTVSGCPVPPDLVYDPKLEINPCE